MDMLNDDNENGTLPHYDNDDDETWVTSSEKRLEQLVKERDELDGKRAHLDIYRETDHHSTESSPHDDDETWVTSPEKRFEQLAKEKSQLDRKSDHLDDDATWVTSPESRHQQRVKESDNPKGGLTCELCYVTTFDNNLMEQHLMGQSHLSNVEKQQNKCKGDKEFKDEIIFRNEIEKASDHVELNNYSGETLINDEIGAPVIEHTEKGSHLKVAEVEINDNSKDRKIDPESDTIINDEIGAPVIETTEKGDNLKVTEVEMNNNSKERKIIDTESDTIMVEARKKEDLKCDKTLIETIKEKDSENDPLHEVIKAPNEAVNSENDTLHGVIKAPNETVNEDNNAECDVCKIFLGGDGKIERHQIPAHPCIREDIGLLALPAGWTQMVSRTSGVTYYVNSLTKERQWVRPINPVIFTEGTVLDELPEGWVEKKSKSKGCPYYVNKITDQRQWERPTKAPQVDVPNDLSLSTAREEGKLAENAPAANKSGTMLTKLKENQT